MNDAQNEKPKLTMRSRSQFRSATERSMQKGLFAYHRGDYTEALRHFEKACDAASTAGAHAEFVEMTTYILRILAEREEFSRIDRIENHILKILESADLPARLKSRAMYVLGICSCYQDTRHNEAMNRFRKAIDFAVISEDKSAIASPLYGAATVLYARNRYDEALKEIDRLSVLLSCLDLPDLASASYLMRAMILRNQKKTDMALEAAWTAFETLKHNPNLVLYLHTLYTLGTIFQLKGDDTSARLYLDLADRTLKRDEFPRITRLIDEAFKSLGVNDKSKFDLIFDIKTGLLVEKTRGEVHFEGQFILRDLLKTFLENQGRVLTKEDLANAVWREPYDPNTHDNKIYVTIKRLRKLLEGSTAGRDSSRMKYIMRAKAGYFLNPKARVYVSDEASEDTGKTSLDESRLEISNIENKNSIQQPISEVSPSDSVALELK